MSKTSKKLALRRESLRNLDAGELQQVGGGTQYIGYYAYGNVDWYILKAPAGTTSRTDGSFAYQLYIW
jgi:hypothetical protein